MPRVVLLGASSVWDCFSRDVCELMTSLRRRLGCNLLPWQRRRGETFSCLSIICVSISCSCRLVSSDLLLLWHVFSLRKNDVPSSLLLIYICLWCTESTFSFVHVEHIFRREVVSYSTKDSSIVSALLSRVSILQIGSWCTFLVFLSRIRRFSHTYQSSLLRNDSTSSPVLLKKTDLRSRISSMRSGPKRRELSLRETSDWQSGLKNWSTTSMTHSFLPL